MKTIKAIFLLVLFTGIITSCDVLDQKPEASFTPDNFYKNSADAVSAMSSVYDPMNNAGMYGQIMWILSDQSTDDAEWGNGRNTANQPKNDLDKYTFTPTTSTFQTLWTILYQGINRANTVIERVPVVPMDTDLKNRLVAEAKFMRGFYYFTLVRYFGGVPLVLKETTSLTDLAIARASEDEVYKQVIQDFTDAENVLPLNYSTADRGRATKGAAKAFLAKVYLTRQDWVKSAAKSKEVIDLGIYDLWANFADAFVIANKNGKEAIFEMQAQSGGLGEGSFMAGYMRPSFDRVNGLGGFGDNPPTDNLFKTYKSTDKRRDITLKLFTTTGSPAAPTNLLFPCYVVKYLDPASTSQGDGGNNFPIIRYSDVLLMYAEALNEQNINNADAYKNFNRIRGRAGLPNLTTNLTQAQFRDSLFVERRLELAFEGHRRYDLIRSKRLISAMKAQNSSITVQEFNYLLPIPQGERDVNTKLEQNLGY